MMTRKASQCTDVRQIKVDGVLKLRYYQRRVANLKY